jgi:hypothetical protein
MHVCTKTTFAGWPSLESRQISSFRNFLSFMHNFRKYFKLVYRTNVVMVTLATGVMFLLFTSMHFWVGEFYEGGPSVHWPPMKWFTIGESLRNSDLHEHTAVGRSF